MDMISLPRVLSCNLYKSCTGIQCCVDVPLVGKSFEVIFDIDACSNRLDIAIENLHFDVSLLSEYQWGKSIYML